MPFFEIFKGLKVNKDGKIYVLTGEINAQEKDSQLSNYLFFIRFLAKDPQGRIISFSLADLEKMRAIPSPSEPSKKSK